jgi:hypothetical protein
MDEINDLISVKYNWDYIDIWFNWTYNIWKIETKSFVLFKDLIIKKLQDFETKWLVSNILPKE